MSRWHEGKQSLRVGVTSPLQEGREIGILQWNPDLFDNLATGREIATFERCFSLVARGKVGDESHDLCKPLLRTAQSATIADDRASVQLVRTKNGDLSIRLDVLASMITVGFLASGDERRAGQEIAGYAATTSSPCH